MCCWIINPKSRRTKVTNAQTSVKGSTSPRFIPGHVQAGTTALTENMPQEVFLRVGAQPQGQRHPGIINGG